MLNLPTRLCFCRVPAVFLAEVLKFDPPFFQPTRVLRNRKVFFTDRKCKLKSNIFRVSIATDSDFQVYGLPDRSSLFGLVAPKWLRCSSWFSPRHKKGTLRKQTASQGNLIQILGTNPGLVFGLASGIRAMRFRAFPSTLGSGLGPGGVGIHPSESKSRSLTKVPPRPELSL